MHHLLHYNFLTFYGILQNTASINIHTHSITISNINTITENWITNYLQKKNISFYKITKYDDTIEIITNFNNFSPIEKHFIMWLYPSEVDTASTIHPYLFYLNQTEFFHLLRGWIFGSTKYIFNDKANFKDNSIIFIFINQSHNNIELIKLIQKFNLKYGVTQEFDDSNFIFLELESDILKHFS
jgi:hypothetical protein